MRARATLCSVFALTLLGGAPGATAAEDADPWNAEKAAAAAAQLAEALDGLRDALRKAPSARGGGGRGTPAGHRLRDRLRLMENESKHLARELAGGAGRDETFPVFQRINEIRRDAVTEAQRTFLQQPVLEQIAAARAPLEELAGYYGVELTRQLQTR